MKYFALTAKYEIKKPQSVVKLVLMPGLEPGWDCSRGILSPLRLPISPHQHLEAPHRIELWIKALQASALPLGYGAISLSLSLVAFFF